MERNFVVKKSPVKVSSLLRLQCCQGRSVVGGSLVAGQEDGRDSQFAGEVPALQPHALVCIHEGLAELANLRVRGAGGGERAGFDIGRVGSVEDRHKEQCERGERSRCDFRVD